MIFRFHFPIEGVKEKEVILSGTAQPLVNVSGETLTRHLLVAPCPMSFAFFLVTAKEF